jgi:deoxyribodipyrimidine photolyase-related protein
MWENHAKTERKYMTGVFREAMDSLRPDHDPDRWVFVGTDQLNDRIGPLNLASPDGPGILLVESREKYRRRPYHRQRIALEWANQRQFALEQTRRGVSVRYVQTESSIPDAVGTAATELGGLVMMEAAERETRVELHALERAGMLEVRTHDGWLTTCDDFDLSCLRRKTWRMDAFYRHVRKRTGILMEGGKPVGGRWSFDVDNRKSWKGEPLAPEPPRFNPDEIDLEVIREVESEFPEHPGALDPQILPTTSDDATRLWSWAKTEALPYFGPYEDAMSVESRTLFHTGISALMNLHRLLPAEILADVLELDLPVQSREGFVRQVLGWREFVRHVHLQTDGFRQLPDASVPNTSSRRGAEPNLLGANQSLPPAWWGEPSGLACLDEVVEGVWETGYGHHITRLMVLSNLASLLDISPRELTDWFWVAYTDAWDWVVEPNVLAMGTHATGTLMTTKPYVSGAAYINRMSDYCAGCAFDPRKTCPITNLYWAYLARHRDQLEGNVRLAMPYRSLAKRDAAQRDRDQLIFERVSNVLARGGVLAPQELVDD